MLEELVNTIDCEICGGALHMSASATIEDYAIVISATTNNVSDKVGDVIGKYLVYECSSCHAKYKYTYKDLEKVLRKNLTKKMLMFIANGSITNSNPLSDKFFFYCGKCGGFDGNGSCPKSVFNNCEIKRFPLNGE
jgi:DNA-directed RNA polymerase subunit M/transcription elongation factor TFIIS